MRIRELALLAYGPFTNALLAFESRGLHVIYGRNEAGKSTALRAVRGLLFGIEKNTDDAHLHAMKDLRLGATLEDEAGNALRVVRRKGNTNTLLDAAGVAIDDAVLRRLLGGVTEDLFVRMFGLDHETLRQGAQALLLGKGEIGESLFGASLGSEVHETLRALSAEADALFTPQARARPLNDALKTFAEAQKRVRALSESQALLTQQQGLDDAMAERTASEEQRRALLAEQSRLRRAQRVRPLVARRVALQQRRALLGRVVILPEGASKAREEAMRDATEGRLEEERLARDLAEIAARRAALHVPDSLVEREDLVDDILGRLGGHRKAMIDLPRVRAELETLEGEALAILRKMRKDLALDDVEALRIEPARQAQIKKLALLPARLDEKLRSADRARADKDAALRERRAKQLVTSGDARALARAAESAQKQGDIEARLRKLAAEVSRLDAVVKARVGALGLPRDVRDARALPVPPEETVERFAQRWAALEKRASELAAASQSGARRRAELARDIDALERGFAVPTEEGLHAARARRGEAWQEVRRAWRRGDAAELEASYERRVEEADTVADRLRREAERVARLGGLLADRDALARDEAESAVERAEVARLASEARAEWAALWTPLGVEPLPPIEMRAWLSRHREAVAAIEELAAAELEHRETASRVDDLRGALLVALGDDHRADDLATLAARAGDRAREREEGDRAIAILERELDALERDRRDATAELAAWRTAWAKDVAALGLGAEASPEDATAILDDVGDLFRRVDEAEKVRRRVRGMERDATHFAADVERIVSEHAPDLAGTPVDQAAALLAKRYQLGCAALAERRQIDAQGVEKRASLDAQIERRVRADARLTALREAAGVDSNELLMIAEQRAADAQDFDRQLALLDEQITELGGEAGHADLAALDADALDARLEELEGTLSEVSRRHEALDRKIGAFEKGADDLRNTSAAAQAASEAQESLAKIRAHVDRYVRVRLAASVLAREIARYREKHQGPVMSRASELFRRLTLGSYAGLRVGYDESDEAQLRCVRASGGAEVDVLGLSDGTRDQLYLALRLASLERYAATNAPMPLVVDDILVHFDDERARAALEVLAEVAAKTQVLLFTHHARIVELAEALPHAQIRALGDAAQPREIVSTSP